MNRTSFLIDGFNLYHSVKQAATDLGLGGAGTRWLDLRRLCSSYLHLVSPDAALAEIHYFTALATHLEPANPNVTLRHRDYIRCLEATDVLPVVSRFKEKRLHCPHCNSLILRHEEKETDVAIALRLIELLHSNRCDTIVVMTGDTDIAPAVRMAQHLYPGKRLMFSFPYRRKNKELAQLVGPGNSFVISSRSYTQHQLPDPMILPDGSQINKPAKW